MGAKTLMAELMIDAKMELLGDSSACHGTLHREGSGRIKHLELKQLWLQQKIRQGELTYTKISRDRNPADSLCKPWQKDGDKHFGMLSFVVARHRGQLQAG